MRRAALLLLASAALLPSACRVPRTSGSLRQEAYVWQRDWKGEVATAVAGVEREYRAGGATFSGLTILAAQVDLRSSPADLQTVAYDARALRAAGLPVGLAIRIGPFPGLFSDRRQAMEELRRLALDLLEQARAAGLTPAELQLDYDCPESKLEDYLLLLRALRPAVRTVPLTLTALPAWLAHRGAFRDLIEAADGYILQVHSLSPPQGLSGDFVLTRPEEARSWVEEAARFGHPFRVALPTYSYAAAFDGQGTLLGLAAEGGEPLAQEGVRWRLVRADPVALAGLVRGWTASRPAALAGLLWYRLPVPGDRRNWSPPALRAVMAGRAPRRELRAAPRLPDPASPELVEIELVNAGETEAERPERIVVHWNGDPPLAADALAGYRLQAGPRSAHLLAPRQAVPALLRPGERRTLAWLRFATPTEVKADALP